tara:strand:+ start:3211 stop:3870 length:660 start_codon:yes stop_codon:yes gene_type:complete
MNMNESYNNAQAIVSYLTNIDNDVQYINNLKNTIMEAQNMGVNVGDAEQNLTQQIDDLNQKKQKIDVDINESLNKLIQLEENIKKDDTKLVFHDTATAMPMSNSDKFMMVYDRLMLDKQSLDAIMTQINQWNNNNSLTIDVMSVENLKNSIHDALVMFNDEIKMIAEEAKQYSEIVKTNTTQYTQYVTGVTNETYINTISQVNDVVNDVVNCAINDVVN